MPDAHARIATFNRTEIASCGSYPWGWRTRNPRQGVRNPMTSTTPRAGLEEGRNHDGLTRSDASPIRIVDWLKAKVVDDPRALAWFSSDECEDRIVRGYRELLSGYAADPTRILKETRPESGTHRGVVGIRDINFFSICAHHFLPFFGKIDIYYVPGTRIIGLGKFPRLVAAYSRRFQIQEDLVKQIAHEIAESGGALAVDVRSRARHMCMCSRGPSDHTAVTETSYTLGDRELLTAYRVPSGS